MEKQITSRNTIIYTSILTKKHAIKKTTDYATLQAETMVAVPEFWWMRLSIVLIVAHRTCPDVVYVVGHVCVADGEDLLDAESTVTLFIWRSSVASLSGTRSQVRRGKTMHLQATQLHATAVVLRWGVTRSPPSIAFLNFLYESFITNTRIRISANAMIL